MTTQALRTNVKRLTEAPRVPRVMTCCKRADAKRRWSVEGADVDTQKRNRSDDGNDDEMETS